MERTLESLNFRNPVESSRAILSNKLLADDYSDYLRDAASSRDRDAARQDDYAAESQGHILIDGLLFFGIGIPSALAAAWGISSFMSKAKAGEVSEAGLGMLVTETAKKVSTNDFINGGLIVAGVVGLFIAWMAYRGIMNGIEYKADSQEWAASYRDMASDLRRQADERDNQ